MAHRRSSIKKIRVDRKRRARNLQVLSVLKNAARKVKTSLLGKKYEEALKGSRILFSKLDKAVKKGILHKNRSSRLKSRLSRRINALQKKV